MLQQSATYGMVQHQSMYYSDSVDPAAMIQSDKEAFKLAALRESMFSPFDMNKALIYGVSDQSFQWRT